MTDVVTNPTKVTVTEPRAQADKVHAMAFRVGLTSGGPYRASKAVVPLSHLKREGDVFTAVWSALTFTPPLEYGQVYSMVVQSVNAASDLGEFPQVDNYGRAIGASPQASGNGPEVQFRLEKATVPPAGPTGTTLE